MRIVRFWAALAAVVLGTSPLLAQGVVQQIGPVTSGHVAAWWMNGQIYDGGSVPLPNTTNSWTAKQTFGPGTTNSAPISVLQGVAPTNPVNGDCWTTSLGFYCRINGATQGPFAAQNPTITNVLATTTGGAGSLQGGDYTAFISGAIQTRAYMVGGPVSGGGVFIYAPSCVPNNVTCVQDTAANNWQLAQNYPVSVLQAGAYGDATHDDTTAIQRGVNLFMVNGVGSATGTLYFCGMFDISKPIVYSGAPGQSVIFKGCQSGARGVDFGAALIWTGNGYPAMFIGDGANETVWDGINFDSGPAGSGLIADLWLSADNTTSTTLNGAVSPGNSVSFSVNAVSSIRSGRLLGIGSGTPNFEVVLVQSISGTTVTANIANHHASGEKVGQSAGSSGATVKNSSMLVPVNAHSTLNGAITSGSNVTITPVSMSGITLGSPIFLGSVAPTVAIEIVYPLTIGPSSFTANVLYNHDSGEDVVSADSAILIGNVTTGPTDQVSETRLSDIVMNCYDLVSGGTYAGARYIEGGNVKNHQLKAVSAVECRYALAFELSSGTVSIRDFAGASTYADVLAGGGGPFLIEGLESEDAGARMIQGIGPGASSAAMTIINSSFQGSAPPDDYIISYGGSLTLIGNNFFNERTDTSIPKIRSVGLFYTTGTHPSAITSIGNFYQNAATFTTPFYDCCGNAINYSSYPIGAGLTPVISSIGDYGSNGMLQNMMGSVALMGAGPTIDSLSPGISFPSVARAGGTYTPIVVPYGALQAASTTKNLAVLGLPPKTKIVAAYVDVTAAFTGSAGTIQLKLGTSSGGNDLMLAFDAKSAPVTAGLASADLGTCLATPIQNGCLPAWAGFGSTVYLGAVSGTGNLSALSAGSATVWIETEALR